jgi:hypothetical protein
MLNGHLRRSLSLRMIVDPRQGHQRRHPARPGFCGCLIPWRKEIISTLASTNREFFQRPYDGLLHRHGHMARPAAHAAANSCLSDAARAASRAPWELLQAPSYAPGAVPGAGTSSGDVAPRPRDYFDDRPAGPRRRRERGPGDGCSPLRPARAIRQRGRREPSMRTGRALAAAERTRRWERAAHPFPHPALWRMGAELEGAGPRETERAPRWSWRRGESEPHHLGVLLPAAGPGDRFLFSLIGQRTSPTTRLRRPPPSISVKRNVTVPDGRSDIAWPCLACSGRASIQ